MRLQSLILRVIYTQAEKLDREIMEGIYIERGLGQ